MKTRIITIEGIDGSGKTVQLALLESALVSMGFSVAKRAYPVYDAFFGAQVGGFLSGSGGVSAVDVDQKSMALWFALDRWEDFKGYTDGETDFLIINRYVLSNAVYQSVREQDMDRPDIIDWVFELEYNHFALPRPVLNLFFDVEPECAGRNVDSKGYRDYIGKGRDAYESSGGIQQRARAKYLQACERFDDIAIIKCTSCGRMLEPEAISHKVIDELKRRGII